MPDLLRVHEFYSHMGGLLDTDLLQLADYCESVDELQLVLMMQIMRKLKGLK